MTRGEVKDNHLCMPFLKGGLEQKDFVRIYESLLVPRRIEERMLVLLRQGRLSKWFSGIGQEAIAVGATLALTSEDYILPLHRNLGVFTSRGLPYARIFAQLRGAADGYTKGRDRSFHFGAQEARIVGMISHLAAQLGVADGIALAARLSRRPEVVLAFCGEGATSEGDFHEALNLASVWRLPVIFLIENNGYGLSTPTEEQYACAALTDRGKGYGIEARAIDGNNVLSVYHNVRYFADQIRAAPRPVLLEARTFRVRGHEEASGTKYVPDELIKHWEQRDPLGQYMLWLEHEGFLDRGAQDEIDDKVKEAIEEAVQEAFAAPLPEADTMRELSDVYAPADASTIPALPSRPTLHSQRFIDAIRLTLEEEMRANDQIILMGQDIGSYGGVFKATEGLIEVFGAERVRNTPLCESAVLGAALGLAIRGFRPVVEMQFADFVSCGFNQIVNNFAKTYYRWAQPVGVVVRMPTGAGLGGGPFHSQSTEAWFMHTPGLKVLYPSSVWDARGLLSAALREPNPCLFFEHKALYRSLSEEIPTERYITEIGKAKSLRSGRDATIITYGMGVHWASEAIKVSGYDVELLDLCTLLPWDKEAVSASVEKTHRVLILYESCYTSGVGAEISAWISEHCFESLDAPPLRVASLDTPVPYVRSLEEDFLPIHRLSSKLEALIRY